MSLKNHRQRTFVVFYLLYFIVFLEITRKCLSSFVNMKTLPGDYKGCSLVTLAKSGLVYNATSECIMCYPYEDGLEVSQYSPSTRNLVMSICLFSIFQRGFSSPLSDNVYFLWFKRQSNLLFFLITSCVNVSKYIYVIVIVIVIIGHSIVLVTIPLFEMLWKQQVYLKDNFIITFIY